MNAFSRRISSFALSSLLTKRQLRNSLAGACLALVAGACYAQGTQMVIYHRPVSTFGSGGNPGLIQAVEENSATGAIVESAGTIQLVVSNGATGYLPGSLTFTPGSTTSSITPTYVNGIATFDLSTLPLYAYPSAATYNLTFTDTVTGSITASTTVSVNTVSGLYIVTSFADSGTGTCPNFNTVTSTPSAASMGSTCSMRVALGTSGGTTVASLASTAYATIAFSNVNAASNPGTWPQILTVGAANMSSDAWVANLTIAGPGVNNLIISGGNTSTVTPNGFPLLAEKSGASPLTISGLTMANAYSGTSADGAAIFLNGGLNAWNVYFYENISTSAGGAFYAPTTATAAFNINVNYCVFDSNSDTGSYGGAFAINSPQANITVSNSLFYDNSSSSSGGAIYMGGTMTTALTNTVSNSTFLSNTATANGGGVEFAFNSGSTAQSTVSLTNDTFYGNSAAGSTGGGAIYITGGSSSADYTVIKMVDNTIVGNSTTDASATGGGGMYVTTYATSYTLYNSILVDNASASSYPDLKSTATATFTPATLGNKASAASSYTSLSSLGLSDLGTYGGPQLSIYTGGKYYTSSGIPGAASALASPPTLVPMPASPALKVGNGTSQQSIASDARGVVRATSSTANIDLGAVQTSPSVVFTADAAPANTAVGVNFSPTPTVAYEDDGYVLTNTHTTLPIVLAINNGGLNGTVSYPTLSTTMQAFSSVSPKTAGTGDYLSATAGSGTGQTTANTSTFNVEGDHAVFATNPSSTLSAGSSSASFNVNVDAGASVDTSFSSNVYLHITGPVGYTTYNTSTTAASGTATFSSLPALTIPGSYTYTLSIDAFPNTDTSNAIASETVSINTTTLTLSESSNTLAYGSQDLITATLSPSSQGSSSTNGETITFFNNGISIGTGTLSSGTATLSTANLPTGPNSLTASYAGDASFSSFTASALGETSTPAPSSTVSAGTATATFTFTQNFTLESIAIVNTGTSGTAFTNSGGSTCAVSGTYGSGGTASCSVGLNYSASGGGLQTATVEVFDNNNVLQGAYNVVTPRYR